MASRLDLRALAAWLAATALSALGWWFGSGVHPLWWLTWLAPLPVLWLAPRLRARWAALAAFVAYAAGGFNQWNYLHDYIRIPMTTIVPAIGGPALAFVLVVLLYRRLLSRGLTLAAALAPATLWVALEYASSRLSPHGTFGNIAYTQMDAIPVIQVAAVSGLWGISYLLLLLPSALAVQVSPRATRRGRWSAGALALLLAAMALGYGSWRLQVPATATLRIGLLSLEKPIRPALDSAAGRDLLVRYADAIGRLADAGAKIVVIPETSFATGDAGGVPVFAQLAQHYGLSLAAGIDLKGAPQERNMIMAFQANGAAPATYNKHHLVPGFERQYAPGQDYRMLDGSPRIGLAICKDMDFHDIGQAYAVRGAQLLLVPAWDFRIDGWLHARMAILRGVESGFAIARAARSGRLTLSDDRGQVVAEASSEHHDAELVGNLPLHHTRTLYARWGDWFVWLDLAVLLVLLGLAWRPAPD